MLTNPHILKHLLPLLIEAFLAETILAQPSSDGLFAWDRALRADPGE